MDALHALTDHVVVAGDPAGTLGRANAVALLDGAGTVVVDTMLVPSQSEPLRRLLAQRGAPAALVLNTHPHADHVGGNAAFAGARCLASPATVAMVALLAEQARDPAFLGGLFPAYADELACAELVVPGPVAPTDLPAGIELLDLGPAHSPGDLAVWLPAESVVVCGDVCFNGVTPLALPGHASLAGWTAALDHLLTLGAHHVVPGHGPVTTPSALAAVREYLEDLAGAARLVTAGELTAEAALERLRHSPAAGWAEPGRHGLNLRVAVAEAAGEGSVHAGAPRTGAAGIPADGPKTSRR